MKKLLFLLLITISSYGQTYQNPTFGTVTTKTAPTSATDPYVGTINSDGKIGKVAPENIPITITPPTTFYTPVTSDLKGHLQGIDNALGDIPLTTAGNTTRVWFTGDVTTITAGTFYLTNAQNKGTVANVSQSVTNDDNQKKYFTQDLIGNAFATTTIFPPGVYAGNLSASTTPNSARQRFTVELYRCDTNGTPIASGISGAPVGDLGVTVIIILDSGELTLADGSVTNVQVSASLASQLTVNVGERIRYHVSAEKVGTIASNITESVWYGSSFNSFLDVPTPITSSGVTNVSTVTGSSVTNALDNLNVADQAVAGAGVTYGHITDGAQTIAGVKTFSSSPIVPTPTTGLQVSNKDYSDTKLNYTSFYQTPIKLYNQFIDVTKNANIVFLGDSNFDTPERMPLPFLKSLLYLKKSAGIGYFSFSAGTVAMGMNVPVRTGTWVDTDIFSGGLGLDGRDTFSNTINSEITITTNTSYVNTDQGTFDNMRVFYRQGNAGTVSYSINGGTFTNVVLTTGSGALGAFDIPTGSLSSSWSIRIKLISGEVRLLGGIISNNTDRGLIVHKIASSGSASSHFSTLSNNASWKSALTLTDPSVIFIGLTTNDFNNNVPTATTKSNLTNLINNIKTAVPSASIYMIAPPKSDPLIVPVQPVTALINAATLKEMCNELNVGFISLFDSWNKLPESYTSTLYADGVHYNALGAESNSNDLKRYLGIPQGVANMSNSITTPNTITYIPLNMGLNNYKNSRLKEDSGLALTIAENNFKIEGNFLMPSNNGGASAFYIDRVSAANSRRFKFSNDRTAQGMYEFQSERTVDSGTYTTEMAISGLTGNVLFGTVSENVTDKVQIAGSILATQFKLSALNTAPATSTSTGTTGEIRIVNGFIYVCVATNTWQRAAMTTF